MNKLTKLILATLLVMAPGITNAATLTSDGAWCWFADPRSFYSNGKTYYGFVNKTGDIMVERYNHTSNTVDQSVNLKADYQYDDHANPAMQELPGGKIAVFFSQHNGPEMKYRVTATPGSFATWGASGLTVPGPAYRHTYPNLAYLNGESVSTNGKMFLFWRGQDMNPRMKSVTGLTGSTHTWGETRRFVDTGYEWPYVKQVTDGNRRIHLFISKGHPNRVDHNSLYHMYYEGGYFHKSDGTVIKSVFEANTDPITRPEMTLIYTPEQQAWNWDIALNGESPVVAFATMNQDGTNHKYHRATYANGSWTSELIGAGGGHLTDATSYYSGGIALDHSDTDTVYLSNGSNGIFEIEKWVRSGTWSKVSDITSGSDDVNARPIVPRNHHQDLSVIWMKGSYPDFTVYDTSLMGL